MPEHLPEIRPVSRVASDRAAAAVRLASLSVLRLRLTNSDTGPAAAGRRPIVGVDVVRFAARIAVSHRSIVVERHLRWNRASDDQCWRSVVVRTAAGVDL